MAQKLNFRRRHFLRNLTVILMCTACQSDTKHHSRFRSVPDWAKTVVWYQIFPERFANGDPGNDPRLTDILAAWPHDGTGPYQTASWTADWYAYQQWEDPGKDLYHHIQRRRYGGDLQGVLNKLDYLQDLGISALYFNPVFEAPSLHKYDAATYHHIDPTFGPDPEGDARLAAGETPEDPSTWKWTSADRLFLQLIEACHRRGMYVIIDGVFNHVGRNFWAFRDVREKGPKSTYADWFTINSWDDPRTPENEFDYAGWFGVKELPELREDENGIVAGAREYIFHAVRRWMDPNGDGDPTDGVDGWRLDVADMVGMPFWREFRRLVRTINPRAYLVGELWWEDWTNNVMIDPRPWLQEGVFDAFMNYHWAAEVIHFFVDHQNKITASEFDARLQALRDRFDDDHNAVLMNLLDSHDTDRLASQIVNPDDDYDHRDSPRDNPNYDVRKPTASEIQIQKLVVLFQMTYVGAPMVYYGDEAGMWGADDPDCRKPMLWPELKFEPERSHPFGKPRPVDANRFNRDLFNHYRKLIHLRREHPALQTGGFETVLADAERDLYAFKRHNADETLVVVVNNAATAQEVRLSTDGLPPHSVWRDLLSGAVFTAEYGAIRVPLAAKSGGVLK